MNKNQFMLALQHSLQGLGPDAVIDILADFEEHFANGLARGKTEAEVAAELGDPLEIARQYLDSASNSIPQPVTDRPVQPTRGKVNEPALIAVILFNVFLGIPIWFSLYGALFGFWVSAGGIGVAACVLFTAAILRAGITSLILSLFGLSLTALTILAVILMVYLTKWLCQGLSWYIRWNKKLVIGGRLA